MEGCKHASGFTHYTLTTSISDWLTNFKNACDGSKVKDKDILAKLKIYLGTPGHHILGDLTPESPWALQRETVQKALGARETVENLELEMARLKCQDKEFNHLANKITNLSSKCWAKYDIDSLNHRQVSTFLHALPPILFQHLAPQKFPNMQAAVEAAFRKQQALDLQPEYQNTRRAVQNDPKTPEETEPARLLNYIQRMQQTQKTQGEELAILIKEVKEIKQQTNTIGGVNHALAQMRQQQQPALPPPAPMQAAIVKCFNCNQPGHIVRKCPYRMTQRRTYSSQKYPALN